VLPDVHTGEGAGYPVAGDARVAGRAKLEWLPSEVLKGLFHRLPPGTYTSVPVESCAFGFQVQALADTAYAALNSGDLEGFLALVADDVEFTSMVLRSYLRHRLSSVPAGGGRAIGKPTRLRGRWDEREEPGADGRSGPPGGGGERRPTDATTREDWNRLNGVSGLHLAPPRCRSRPQRARAGLSHMGSPAAFPSLAGF
jgi:hypothetical protein